MIRIGPAAAPRWWEIDGARLPAYLDHIAAAGATSVELIVHHGPASRDPASVHLDRTEWSNAVRLAVGQGLHIDLHNSLDARFRLSRWTDDGAGLRADLMPIVDLLVEIEQGQSSSPCLIVHAADGLLGAEETTRAVLIWLVSALADRGSSAHVAVELRAAVGPDDRRFDRDRARLHAFVRQIGNPRVGICWDVANDWLANERRGVLLAMPERATLASISHVHVHGSATGGLLHAPLRATVVPWEEALAHLSRHRWSGSVTLEIRYRLANNVGEPWLVLADSLYRAINVRGISTCDHPRLFSSTTAFSSASLTQTTPSSPPPGRSPG